jgi:hypothetical protein
MEPFAMYELEVKFTLRGTYKLHDGMITVRSGNKQKSTLLGGMADNHDGLARIMLRELLDDAGLDAVVLRTS